MTESEANVSVMRQAFALLSAGKVDELSRLLVDDFIINIGGAPTRHGKDAWRQNVAEMLGAFPDLRAEIDDIFGSGDRVAVRLTFTGTHTGSFQGMAPTGRKISYPSAELYRLSDGQVAEEWIFSDVPTMMGQLTGPEAAAMP